MENKLNFFARTVMPISRMYGKATDIWHCKQQK